MSKAFKKKEDPKKQEFIGAIQEFAKMSPDKPNIVRGAGTQILTSQGGLPNLGSTKAPGAGGL